MFKILFQIECDFVGFGMVLSESDPPVVKFVSPEGPAVAAGLKVTYSF